MAASVTPVVIIWYLIRAPWADVMMDDVEEPPTKAPRKQPMGDARWADFERRMRWPPAAETEVGDMPGKWARIEARSADLAGIMVCPPAAETGVGDMPGCSKHGEAETECPRSPSPRSFSKLTEEQQAALRWADPPTAKEIEAWLKRAVEREEEALRQLDEVTPEVWRRPPDKWDAKPVVAARAAAERHRLERKLAERKACDG